MTSILFPRYCIVLIFGSGATLRYPTLPYPTLPYTTLHYPTLPYTTPTFSPPHVLQPIFGGTYDRIKSDRILIKNQNFSYKLLLLNMIRIREYLDNKADLNIQKKKTRRADLDTQDSMTLRKQLLSTASLI